MPKKKKIAEPKPTPVVEKDPGKGSKAIDVAIKALKKKFGPEVVEWLGKRPEKERGIISTGSIGLDSALGVGGLVKGRIYELYGPPSGGKTTLAFAIMKELQKTGGKTLFVDAEHAMDEKLMVKMGLDMSLIVDVRGYTGEDNLDLAKTLIATGEFDLCVIDSVSALQPAAEANLESFGDQTMGLHPRLMSRMSRDLTPRCARTDTALVLINQIRANLSGYGKKEMTSGGNALRHHITGKIRVSGGGTKASNILDGKGEVVGHKVSFEITKNKLASPFRKAEVDLKYGVGFDVTGELVDLGVDMGFVDRAGAWYSYNGDQIGQGRAKAVQFLAENPDTLKALRSDVVGMLGFSPDGK